MPRSNNPRVNTDLQVPNRRRNITGHQHHSPSRPGLQHRKQYSNGSHSSNSHKCSKRPPHHSSSLLSNNA